MQSDPILGLPAVISTSAQAPVKLGTCSFGVSGRLCSSLPTSLLSHPEIA